MTSSHPVSLRAINVDDAPRVGDFLQQHLNSRVSSARWAGLINPPWGATGPNRGFQLLDSGGEIVGAYVAVYSTRNEGALAVCNLGAFCVLEEYRSHSLRLMHALLRQKGFLFTDLSPSGNVPAINERLGFKHLDVRARLTINMPWWSRHDTVTADRAVLEDTLTGFDAEVYRDHGAASAARHLLVTNAHGYAYLLYRRDQRKRIPLFASPLYVGGDRELLRTAWPAVATHLAARGFLATLAERRVLGFTPRGLGRELSAPRPRMYRSASASPEDVDYLYSELTLVEW